MAKKDKKNRTCISYSKTVVTLQKLRQHYKSPKNNYNPQNVHQLVSTSEVQIQEPTSKIEVIQTLVPKLESQKKAPILEDDYITEEEAKNWISSNT